MESPQAKLAHGGRECGPMAGPGDKNNIKYLRQERLPTNGSYRGIAGQVAPSRTPERWEIHSWIIFLPQMTVH